MRNHLCWVGSALAALALLATIAWLGIENGSHPGMMDLRFTLTFWPWYLAGFAATLVASVLAQLAGD